MPHHDRRLNGWQARPKPRNLVRSIYVVTPIPITIDHKQHFGFNLPKSIEHRPNTEFGRA